MDSLVVKNALGSLERVLSQARQALRDIEREAFGGLVFGDFGEYEYPDQAMAGFLEEPMQPRSLSQMWSTITTTLPRIRFHDLRHAHATHMLAAGVHSKVASERLGHSRVGITLDLYSHVLPGMQEDAAARVDEAFQSPKEARGKHWVAMQTVDARADYAWEFGTIRDTLGNCGEGKQWVLARISLPSKTITKFRPN